MIPEIEQAEVARRLRRAARAWLLLALALVTACENSGVAQHETPTQTEAPAGIERPSDPAADSTPAGIERPSDPAADSIARSRAHRRVARVPFSGATSDGGRFASADWAGRRFIAFVFDLSEPRTAAVGLGVSRVARLGSQHNFGVVGIASGGDAESVAAFAGRIGADFPIVLDPDRAIAHSFGGSGRLGLVGVDHEGEQAWYSGGFPDDPDLASIAAEAQLREYLRLPAETTSAASSSDARTPAPRFSAPRLGGGPPFELDSAAGRPLVLIFFLHRCPYCQAALGFHTAALAEIPEARRPRIVGVEISGASDEVVASRLSEMSLPGLEVVRDPDWQVQHAYGVFGDVPVMFYLDEGLRIVHRGGPGWDMATDPPLSTMYIARMLGVRVPAMLSRHGYTGNQICGACHPSERAAWEATPHATALDTLVEHGRHRDSECVKCHTVGFGEPGGYEFPTSRHAPDRLEGVGCESCHGRGGPHMPGAEPVDYAARCRTCHDEVHSLGFDFGRDVARVSHAAIASLDAGGRRALRASERPLLSQARAYVGSDACGDCHEREFALWSEGGHARAGNTIAHDAAASKDCLRCHTTGYGRKGGFPEGARIDRHADLGRVGCESCHGPGGDHVGPDAARQGTIVRLSEKCDSCVILQICGSCHDDQNDPGFAFRIEEMIERQQHGGIWSPGS